MFYARPLLDEIAKMVHEDNDTPSNHEGASDRRAKLQIIATDTWDISDSLSKYRSIARLLEVGSQITALTPSPRRTAGHHHRGGGRVGGHRLRVPAPPGADRDGDAETARLQAPGSGEPLAEGVLGTDRS